MRDVPENPGGGEPVALVTGGGRGIGRATALALAHRGAKVAIVDRRLPSNPAPPLHTALLLERDVEDFDSAATTVSEIEQRLGPLTTAVLNAGISRDAASWKLTEKDWREVIDVNLTGAFAWAQASARAMMTHGGGSMVFISSINGLRGKFGLANYSASKAGLIGLTRTLARELGPRGIRVNAVAPGYIRTDLTAKVEQRYLDQAVSETALGRLGEPEDVAEAVCFLVSERARHITGTVLLVDGGQTA
ncbi:MAG TPA: 3-oxoacyl-ACP reductase FabG [Patescibacteria group bacterium]|nr:3-oxoacyl-ACP reductase FabG [Patescibacteria group bacterium]